MLAEESKKKQRQSEIAEKKVTACTAVKKEKKGNVIVNGISVKSMDIKNDWGVKPGKAAACPSFSFMADSLERTGDKSGVAAYFSIDNFVNSVNKRFKWTTLYRCC